MENDVGRKLAISLLLTKLDFTLKKLLSKIREPKFNVMLESLYSHVPACS